MYDVILADPPWRYAHSRSKRRAIERHYNTMSMEDLANLPVQTLHNGCAVLFMWTTFPKLPQAMELFRYWDFEYKSGFAWNKYFGTRRKGMGYWFRQDQELMLVGSCGGAPAPPHDRRYDASMYGGYRGHSVKPEAAHQRIEGMYPRARKIELFARERRDGWDAWGNEVVSDVQLMPAVDCQCGHWGWTAPAHFARRSHFPVVLPPQPLACLGAA
jgi:N6-adenosine-specific RNA methylase IME4